ncbi:MAG: DUF1559 domain-containing protein [Planctomycetaceae bacterium]|jgi:hypothetical protein|nr:DUF1559 domain-containing protein [Planctomycetaceae bacterium]
MHPLSLGGITPFLFWRAAPVLGGLLLLDSAFDTLTPLKSTMDDQISPEGTSSQPQIGNGKATASLVLGIISCCIGGSPILPVIGLILGLKSKKSGLATAGIWLNAIAILLFFAVPIIQVAREAARRMECSSHIKETAMAFYKYHEANGAFPPLYTVDDTGKPLHSWRVLILPLIEQKELYDKIRLDEPWDSTHNKQFHDQMPDFYHCPSNSGKGCCYSVIAGEAFVPAKDAHQKKGKSSKEILGGVDYTLAIVEVKNPFNWMDPTADITLDELVNGNNASGRVGSFHPDGFHVAMLNGVVKFIPTVIDKNTLRALGTASGGEKISQ